MPGVRFRSTWAAQKSSFFAPSTECICPTRSWPFPQTSPPATGFRWEDVQSAVDDEPTRPVVTHWRGTGTVESWTTPFDRDGNPQHVFLALRTPDGSRTMAVIRDADAAQASVREDIADALVDVHEDGTAALR